MTNKQEVIVIDYINFSATKMAANDFIRKYGEKVKFCGLVVPAFEYDEKSRTIFDKRGGELKPWLVHVEPKTANILMLQLAMAFALASAPTGSMCVGYESKEDALNALKAYIERLYANEGRQLEKIKKAEELYASIKFETF